MLSSSPPIAQGERGPIRRVACILITKFAKADFCWHHSNRIGRWLWVPAFAGTTNLSDVGGLEHHATTAIGVRRIRVAGNRVGIRREPPRGFAAASRRW